MIKSTVTKAEKEIPKKKYPCLKIVTEYWGKGQVVLFSEPGVGVVVHNITGIFPLGHYSETWLEVERFELYTGSITLKND